MSLAKDDFIHSLRIQCGLSKPTSKALFETIFELIKKALESRDDVLVSGFAKSSARKKALRMEKPCCRRGFDPGRQDCGHVQVLKGFREMIYGEAHKVI
jgi:hypothetical protein